jgi:cell division protein ZapA
MDAQQQDPEESLSITVWLAGRSYRIRIKPEEESAVRKAVRLADQKIGDLRNHFMAMCLLMYAADTAIESFNNPVMQEELNKLSKKIDKVLSTEGDQE